MKGTRFPEVEHRLPGYGAFKEEDSGDARMQFNVMAKVLGLARAEGLGQL